jgi:peptidoglycan hydrolase-like protein with peptidoglycan-binding domain
MATAYTLVRPIRDNKLSFARLFPHTEYLGDIGDPSHMTGSGDHTPWSSDSIGGRKMLRGYVYAQDFGTSVEFDTRRFSAWLLTSCSMGRYAEVKYVISRAPGSQMFKGTPVYGLYDRRYGWRRQESSGHDHHIHISYMPGYENAQSTIIADYYAALHRGSLAVSTTPPPAIPVIPIVAETFFRGKRIGSKVPNARAMRADQMPKLEFGARDQAMGGWVTYAEQKLGTPVNGYFGPDEVNAVKALQRRKGYPVTGALGSAEWNSLGQSH